jgi:glycine cleavage system aminomethyltransferase T
MAVVDAGMLAAGGAISVDVLGRERRAALVAGDVLYDPDNSRMKV